MATSAKAFIQLFGSSEHQAAAAAANFHDANIDTGHTDSAAGVEWPWVKRYLVDLLLIIVDILSDEKLLLPEY